MHDAQRQAIATPLPLGHNFPMATNALCPFDIPSKRLFTLAGWEWCGIQVRYRQGFILPSHMVGKDAATRSPAGTRHGPSSLQHHQRS